MKDKTKKIGAGFKLQGKIFATVFLCVVIPASMVCFSACRTANPESSPAVSALKPVSSVSPSSSSQKPSSQQPLSQPTPAQPPSQSAKSNADLSDCAMVGNSCVDDFDTFGILPDMDFYGRVGLTVKTVFTLPTTRGRTPVMDALGEKRYKGVYLLFGENELGWESTGQFIAAYKKVVDAVRAKQPGARIYIQSIFPVSAAVSAKNVENTNNSRIMEYNSKLRVLSEQENAAYLDVASVIADKNGVLPSSASTDGVHLNKKYCRIWAGYLKTHE